MNDRHEPRALEVGTDIRRSLPMINVRPDCQCERTPIFRARTLSVSYGSSTALRDVDVDLPEGCVTALFGPSGCGKTTFLQALNRMTDLIPGCRVTGELRIHGDDLLDDRVDVVSLRRRVGMIFQKPNPFPMSIRRNMIFPLRHHGERRRDVLEERMETALRDVGLWDEVKDRLDAPAQRLSGGQQQRLCLARAIAPRPAPARRAV